MLSHLYCIKKAYENNLDNIIIFEDDLDLTIFNQVYYKITNLFHNLENIEILQLFTSSENYYNNISNTTKLTISNRDYCCWGCCGYIVNYNGMKKIMNLYDYNDDKFNITNYNNYLLSDVLIYDICHTSILNLPIINLKLSSILPSTLDNDCNGTKLNLNNTIILIIEMMILLK